MKSNLTVFVSCLVVVFVFVGGQAMAVDIYGEGASSDTNNDVQVCIYADIGGSEALRSFGVRLVYNSDELSYDDSRSTRNEEVWHLRDEAGTDHPCTRSNCGPKDVEVSAPVHAVVIIGGFLDGTLEHPAEEKVAGNRVLLGTVWFTRVSGSGPLTNPLTLALGQVSPYANFVKGPDPATDVLDASVDFISHGDGEAVVKVRERGDANGDGNITMADAMFVKHMFQGGLPYVCYADANSDDTISMADAMLIKHIYKI